MEANPFAVKTINAREGRVGGYLVIWGDATQRDLVGEYFTPETELGISWYDRRPVFFDHGLDGNLKAAVIGAIDHLSMDEVGVWAEAQLDIRQRYVRAIQQLVDQGKLNWSSGSLPHLVAVAEDGGIKQWPIVEGSLTPTPAEPRYTDVQTIKRAYKSLGLDVARLGIESQMNETDGEKGTMEDSTRLKRLPAAESSTEAAPLEVGSEFDALSGDDLLHGYMLLRASKHFQGVSERYANALAHKLQREGVIAAKTGNELLHSTQQGYGDEWVPDLWSAQIWNKARLENVVLPLLPQIEMPSNPFELPIEGTDPNVYYVNETTDEAHLTLGAGNPMPASKIGSGKVTLRARKLALRVGLSSELVEDSIIPVLNLYREQAMRAIANAIDYTLLNGDTESGATGNINSDHAAPNANDLFMVFDGLRKVALVTDTGAKAVDMGNLAPTLAKLRQARFTMPAQYAVRPNDLAWIVDGKTYAALLSMGEFLTMDKAGPLATAQTGQIGYMDGIPVFVSSQMPETEADGKIGSGTADRGMAVCVYRPGWFVGYRRRIAVNVDYLPYYDSYQLTATVRLALGHFNDNVASTLYNIKV